MRSTTGQYYPGLDHLRALAAFLVFSWHFTHGLPVPIHGDPVPFGGGIRNDFLFLAPFDEGHCGVALFMTLSGYLFAKLLDGKRIHYGNFIWSRFIRLVPLLALVVVANGTLIIAKGEWLGGYVRALIAGLIKPVWPNGGWSITVEMHFYLLLPIILWLKERWWPSILLMLFGAAILRTVLYATYGEVQYFSYLTIIGRIDQFLIGIIAFDARNLIKNKRSYFVYMTVAFLILYQSFAEGGGFYKTISYPSPSAIWIVMPTIEGAYFGFLISYYDNSFKFSKGVISDFLRKIGEYSYSIYLLHFFIVFDLAKIATAWVPGIHILVVAELAAFGCFIMVVPVAWVSYRLIECPFFRFRRKYSSDKTIVD